MKFPEQYRWADAPLGYASRHGDDHGFFIIPKKKAKHGRCLNILAVDGLETGWGHVSVSLADFPNKCPTWNEMCWVKELFWNKNECVVQFHPPESEYVNKHEGCLHLWRPINQEMPIPPTICV